MKYARFIEYGKRLGPYVEDIRSKINESNNGEAILNTRYIADLINMSNKGDQAIYHGVKYIMWYNNITVNPGIYKGEWCKALIFKNSKNGEKLSGSLIRSGVDYAKYRNELAIDNGYKNYNEYQNKLNHKNGICIPFDENKECPQYLGIHIAERMLPLIFENVKRMPYGHPGYDFICNKGFKIDVKSSSLISNNTWQFHIEKNKIADYFFIVAFDNRYNLNVLYMWLIKGDEIIGTRKLNNKRNLGITNNKKRLKIFKEYEITDKLDKVQKACSEFK